MATFENLHSERAAVASILQNPDTLIELDTKLDVAAFKNPANRAIVSLAIDLYNEKGFKRFDRELLQNRISLVQVPGIDVMQMQNYISALFSADIDSVNFGNYIEEIRKSHLRDSLRDTLHNYIENLVDRDPSYVLGDLQSRLYELDAGINRNDDPIDISQTIGPTLDRLVTHPSLGIPTGLSVLDAMMLGWMRKKFYFVGARPGEGKSAFLIQTGLHGAYFAKERRVPVLYIDTEMDAEEFQIRTIGHLAGIDTLIIKQGLFAKDPQMLATVSKVRQFISSNPGFYYKEMPIINLANLVNIMRKYVYNYGVGLVIFDQIEKPDTGSDKQARWEQVGVLVRTLKQQAQLLNISVVAALQQNKTGADKSRVSSVAYGETDDAYKKADGALALNRKSAEEISKETLAAGTHRLQVLKGRYHGTSYNGMNLRYVGYCLRFWPARIQSTLQEHNSDDYEDTNTEQTGIPTMQEYVKGSLIS